MQNDKQTNKQNTKEKANEKFKLQKKPELLAPAGGLEQLHAAINFGADAVYLSGQNFGMRARAANFSDSQIKEAIILAHKNKIKVYITVNILMHQQDIFALTKYFSFLSKIGADAFIIGDLGAAAIAKDVAPNVDLHVSTQASIANSKAAEQWAKMGAKRIVLAREMSVEQISQMNRELQNSKVPDARVLQLEAFVHGAMCMSVSGRCLISTYLTGRSANKGHCTQPCRWGYNLVEENQSQQNNCFEEKNKPRKKFSLKEENRPDQNFPIQEDDFGTYIMNSKDMNMLCYLRKLAEAGVTSFKIEGRNKKAMYVATTVNAYRHVIDSNYDTKVSHKWEKELNTISHRPYSTGFYFGEAQQSVDYDGYEQECIHVADVLECEKYVSAKNKTHQENNNANDCEFFDSDIYKITVLCRNRFEQDKELEALIPNQNIEKIHPKNLVLLKKDKLKTHKEKTSIANRAKSKYQFDSIVKIPEGSILRSREYLRTSRKK